MIPTYTRRKTYTAFICKTYYRVGMNHAYSIIIPYSMIQILTCIIPFMFDTIKKRNYV